MIQSNDANSISRFVNDQFCSVIYMDYDDYNPNVGYVSIFNPEFLCLSWYNRVAKSIYLIDDM